MVAYHPAHNNVLITVASWLLPLHISLVCVLVMLFLWRAFYAWQGATIPYWWLKRGLPDVIDTAVLLSGIALALLFNIAPWLDMWFAIKLLAVMVYIAAGYFCFSPLLSHRHQRGAICIALFTLLYIVALVTTKEIFLGAL
ncbi:MAG: SirB2 family protein [Mariprofundaceae bacterium]|nr:SirB2 family protein [Mariprofundaceae bacterium]